MGRKKTPLEKDVTQLKAKVAERSKASEKQDGDPAFRSLKKRLKRTQRKQRALALRKAHASGKKKTGAQSAAAS